MNYRRQPSMVPIIPTGDVGIAREADAAPTVG